MALVVEDAGGVTPLPVILSNSLCKLLISLILSFVDTSCFVEFVFTGIDAERFDAPIVDPNKVEDPFKRSKFLSYVKNLLAIFE
jgi:hypothetical protein